MPSSAFSGAGIRLEADRAGLLFSMIVFFATLDPGLVSKANNSLTIGRGESSWKSSHRKPGAENIATRGRPCKTMQVPLNSHLDGFNFPNPLTSVPREITDACKTSLICSPVFPRRSPVFP
jgi:hypothetical protein